MENKNKTFKEYISPILVLVIICFVVTFALAFTYGITAPIIETNAAKAAGEARTELLESAEGKFEEYTGDLFVQEEGKVYVEDCYVATNGTGMVITVTSGSYGGPLKAMIGIDKDGAITAVKVTEQTDTPGVGSKAHTPNYLSQYNGLAELQAYEIKKDTSVSAVTGATVSSSAVHKGIYCAVEQFKAMGGVK